MTAKKLQGYALDVSTDMTTLFLLEPELENFIYGHELPHKAGSSPPVKKLVIGANEYAGSEIQMEFDIPDPAEIGNACGLIYERRKR